MCMYVSLCTQCWCVQSSEVLDLPGFVDSMQLWVTGYECWELNLGLLQDQYVLFLMAKLLLQPIEVYFYFMCMYEFLYVYAQNMSLCPLRPVEGIASLETGQQMLASCHAGTDYCKSSSVARHWAISPVPWQVLNRAPTHKTKLCIV